MPVEPIPDGYNTVTPYLIIEGAAAFIEFMSKVFDATIEQQLMRPDGAIGHTEMRIGESMIMLSETAPAYPATPVMLHIYVDDVDSRFARAIAAGAQSVQEPADQFYGDRSGGVKEPSGNTIWIATHIEDVSPDEIKRRSAMR